ncbi:class I SAM-dependent methyltransferase [Amycolatopsis eburnea]|uniref:Class I SAM-dependent methyltransferase n=1 Tax=Amycolatopsis eburnea TaxID=2267691 RepID=A0A3R9ER18_9PSEU|nr:class I SAM-dependent methyltransferase [Amycolatopsis eburnea]RSD16361.1 class I SAM-dependent methyltransferase [Amycolatopsis eburnea]
MIDYDAESDCYDATRGGEPRAVAAATSIERLLPHTARVVVDVGCGSGIVTRHLAGQQRLVIGVDRSAGMIRLASRRLPRRTVLGDATVLPIRSSTADVVLMIWVLHLLRDPEPVLAEGARVLRSGGVLITTVDKNDAPFRAPSDFADVTAAARRELVPQASDHHDRILRLAADHDLQPLDEATFVGIGQGRSPRQWREHIAGGHVAWCQGTDRARIADLCSAISSLSNQETARPDPIYSLVALERRR